MAASFASFRPALPEPGSWPISSGCRCARPCSTLQLSRLATLPRYSDTAANSYTAATTTKHQTVHCWHTTSVVRSARVLVLLRRASASFILSRTLAFPQIPASSACESLFRRASYYHSLALERERPVTHEQETLRNTPT